MFMLSHSFKMRSFNVGNGHEIVLPSGKTLLIDPYYPDKTPGHTQEDIQGADYVIVTHTHFDHELNLGYIVHKFNSKVILPAVSALAEAKYHRLPYDSIYPAFPGSKMTFPDFSIEVFQAKHNTLGAACYDPDVDVTYKMTGVKGDLDVDALGGIFSMDCLITLNNGFKILLASGQNVWEESISKFREIRPNMLIRQCSVRPMGQDVYSGGQVDAETLAKLFTSYNAQILVPFHMDSILKKWDEEKLEQYFRDVAQKVRELDPGAVFLPPKAWAWYNISIDISPAE